MRSWLATVVLDVLDVIEVAVLMVLVLVLSVGGWMM